MTWLVFSYTLSTKVANSGSSSRVTLWRRLQHLGALELTGLYVLPNSPESQEAYSWLSQEVKTAGGQVTVMQVKKINDITDKAMVDMFNAERAKAYQELSEEINTYQKSSPQLEIPERQKTLGKLRRHFEDITRVDFFNSAPKTQIAKLLTKLEHSPADESPPERVKVLKRSQYQQKIWVTRPQPYVDRLACIWLIRRFIDANAVIVYREHAKPTEIGFDMTDAEFGHSGNLCTFEVMCRAFALKDKVLPKLADIVHELDIHNGYYTRAESYGVEAILQGWLRLQLSDVALETLGYDAFEGLYQSLKAKL
jgi:hypothetical protein